MKSPSSGTSHFWMPKGGPPRGRSERRRKKNEAIFIVIIFVIVTKICLVWLFKVIVIAYVIAFVTKICLVWLIKVIFIIIVFAVVTKICLVWLVKLKLFHLCWIDHVNLRVVSTWKRKSQISLVDSLLCVTQTSCLSKNSSTKALIVGYAVL